MNLFRKFLFGLILITILSGSITNQVRAEYMYYSTELKKGMILEWEKIVKHNTEEEMLNIEITIIQDIPTNSPLDQSNYDEYFNLTFNGTEGSVSIVLNDFIWPILYENNSIVSTLTEMYPETSEPNYQVNHTKHTIIVKYVWESYLEIYTKEYTVDSQTGIVKNYVYTINVSNSIWEIKYEFKGGIKLAGYNSNSIEIILISLLLFYIIIGRRKKKTNLTKVE